MVRISDDQDPELLVCADYMKPNKRIERYQVYTASSRKLIHEEQFVPMLRKEALPRFKLDPYGREQKEAPFAKDASVFRLWQQDTKKTVDDALMKDMERWKCHKFIKNEDDLADVKMTVKSNFAEIKHIFANLISGDSFPHIGWNDFTKFAIQTGIMDDTIE